MSTKLQSYLEVIATGKATDQRVKICKLLSRKQYQKKGLTRRQIANITGFELSAVCGRVNELMLCSALMYGDTCTCKTTGKTVERIKIMPVKGVKNARG